jgi:hypothetical protein
MQKEGHQPLVYQPNLELMQRTLMIRKEFFGEFPRTTRKIHRHYGREYEKSSEKFIPHHDGFWNLDKSIHAAQG